MSRCRCDDIEECRDNIQKLNGILNGFRTVDYYIGLINSEKVEACDKYSTAFEGENNEALCADTEEIDSDMKSVRGAIGSKISERISELKGELSDMKDEDHRYHESKKKHH